jgi:hypothetical protein
MTLLLVSVEVQKIERGGLYTTHVFDGGKTKPTVVVGEVIGYIVFTVCTR